MNFFPLGYHARVQKRFREFALTSENELPEPLEPHFLGHFGIGLQPTLQFLEIGNRDATLPKSKRQMIHNRTGRRLLKPRHSRTVCEIRFSEALQSDGGFRLRLERSSADPNTGEDSCVISRQPSGKPSRRRQFLSRVRPSPTLPAPLFWRLRFVVRALAWKHELDRLFSHLHVPIRRRLGSLISQP